MTDMFTVATALQAEILKAQQAQLKAAQTMIDAGQQIADAQAITQRALEANLSAWRAWAKLWGWK